MHTNNSPILLGARKLENLLPKVFLVLLFELVEGEVYSAIDQ